MKQQRVLILVILALVAYSFLVMFLKVGGHPKFPVHYGLDIKGGIRAVLLARTDKLAPGAVYDQTIILRTLENRINSSGVGAATVQPKGTDQFIIEIPEVQDKDAVLKQLNSTASLTFYYFKDVTCERDPNRPVSFTVANDPKTQQEIYTFTDKRTNQTFRDGAQIKADFSKMLNAASPPAPGATEYTVPSPLYEVPASGEKLVVQFTAEQQKRANDLNTELMAWRALLTNSEIILSGNDVEPKSTAHLGGSLGTQPAVSQVFTAAGAAKFADFTREHTKEIMGIVLDDSVLSAPRIDEPILDGQGEITGFSSLKAAQSLADLLNAGALPVPLEQIQVQSVSAGLGADAVQKSIWAGVIGLCLVLFFMLAWYRLPGLVADLALLVYALITFAIFRGGLQWLGVPPVTMTLPGIAGFILSIGMAVDANILIFERMKEELRSGKALRPAIEAGFRRAFTAIRDSNICTCITCIVLLSLGTADVRGFALTLLIGVLVSLFSAITVTRTFLFVLVNSGVANNPVLFGYTPSSTGSMDADTRVAKWNIVGRRKFFYGLSLAIIVPGMIFFGMGGLKKSIEFTGGSQIEVSYANPVTQDAVKSALTTGGFADSLVQMAEGGRVAIVSIRQRSSVPNKNDDPIYGGLMKALSTTPAGAAHEEKFGNVGGVISAELTSKAIQAVIIASLLIVLYLALVFSIGGFVAGLRLGTSAIAALLHDILVLVGSFAIFGYFLNWEIDSLFVTAMLTVIGFSVHDTVVIFDRVRENLHRQQRGESFEQLVNHSIGQTWGRSVRTSLTVLMTLVALILCGGQTTRLLNVALFIGIVSGTYSSIFNAASILVDWENALTKRRSRAGALATAGAAARPSSPSSYTNGSAGSPAAPRPSARPASSPTMTSPGVSSRGGSTTAAGGGTDAPGASTLRPKRKKPARRF